jgi:hypothetical protein
VGGRCEGLESGGDVFEGGLGGGDGDDEVVDVVVGGAGDAGVVELEEDGGGEPAEALVAVDEGVVVDDGLQEGGGLEPDGGVGVVAADGGLGAGDGGAEQADVADRWRVAEEPGGEGRSGGF